MQACPRVSVRGQYYGAEDGTLHVWQYCGRIGAPLTPSNETVYGPHIFAQVGTFEFAPLRSGRRAGETFRYEYAPDKIQAHKIGGSASRDSDGCFRCR
jgi:hypothetical protein